MHKICCHEYIISFYIAIFNRLPSYKKVSNRFNLSLNEKMKLWRLHSRHHLGKTNHGKGDILRLKNGQDCILLMSFSTRVKNNKNGCGNSIIGYLPYGFIFFTTIKKYLQSDMYTLEQRTRKKAMPCHTKFEQFLEPVSSLAKQRGSVHRQQVCTGWLTSPSPPPATLSWELVT